METKVIRLNNLKMSYSKKSVQKFAQPVCSFCKEGHIGFEFVQGKRITKCPTLLNAVCTYCRGKGHTRKNCEEQQRDYANRLRRDKEYERERRRIAFEEEQKVSKSKNTSLKSTFSAAFSDSDSEEEVVKVQQEVQAVPSYASMLLSKEPLVFDPLEEGPGEDTYRQEMAKEIEEEVKPKKKSILERLHEPMLKPVPVPAPVEPTKEEKKEEIRQKRKAIIAEYKAKGKQAPWAVLDEYDTDSDSD